MSPLPITVVIPSIPPREDLLRTAVASVQAQWRVPAEVFIELDTAHAGAAATRDSGLRRVTTPWVAFLDDDDWFLPQHLGSLWVFAQDTGVDYAYSWFETHPAGSDPFPATHFTEPWNPEEPRQTTVTTLVRTELAQEVGFVTAPEDGLVAGQRAGEDWHFTLECNRLGKIGHLVERTWVWRHWGYGQPGIPGNTSGLGSRW